MASGSSKEAPRAAQRLRPALLGLAAIVILGSAFTRSANHDESQYVAAIALMREGWPYRDFAYLQTPLQPLILAPLAYLPAGWMLAGARVTNALLGFATLLFVVAVVSKRAPPAAAVIATAALLCTDAFLLASSLARNDALAMALIASSLPPLVTAIETGRVRMFLLAGLALGLAVSAKINAALPAAAAGLFLLLRIKRFGARPVLAFAGGLFAGLVPTFLLALTAPSEFRFDVFEYNLTAPTLWWTSIGEAGELGLGRRTLKLLGFAALGSILPSFLAAALDNRRSDPKRILDYMIGGSVLAAALPKPALVQYLVPLLPPLFARFGLAIDALRPAHRRALLSLALLGSIAGLASAFIVRFSGGDLLRRTVAAKRLEALAPGARVATLSAQYVAGNGIALDRRFAAGPFLFRLDGPLAKTVRAEGRAVTAKTLDEAFAESPPRAIVIGGEGESYPVFPHGLDAPLAAWAITRGYRRHDLGGGLVAFVPRP